MGSDRTPAGAAMLEQGMEAGQSRVNPDCVVCGQENPCGLRLRFERDGETVISNWTATWGWESFRGIVHGGVVAAILDETMSQAVIAAGYMALTAELRVRFRKKVRIGDELRVRGWVVEAHKRKIRTEGWMVGADGEEKAYAWATFLTEAAAGKAGSAAG